MGASLSARAEQPIRDVFRSLEPALRLSNEAQLFECGFAAGILCESGDEGRCHPFRLDAPGHGCELPAGAFCVTFPESDVRARFLEAVAAVPQDGMWVQPPATSAAESTEPNVPERGSATPLVLGAVGVALLFVGGLVLARRRDPALPGRILRRVVLVLVSLVVSALLLEGALRVLGVAPPVRQVASQEKRDRLTIEQVSLNRLGIREPWNGLPQRVQGEVRIGILGDSFVFGESVSREEALPAATEAILASRLPGRVVRVVNLGRSGDNVPDALGRYPALQEALDLDILLHLTYINDFVDASDALTARLATVGTEPGPLTEYSWLAAHLWSFVGAQREEAALLEGYVRAVETDFPATLEWTQSEFAEAKRRARKDDVIFLVGLFPWLSHLDGDGYPFGPIHEGLASICGKEKLPFLDLLTTFRGKDGRQLRVAPHDEHPNAAAHRMAAEAIAEFLLPFVSP